MPHGLKLGFPGGGRAAIELDGSDPGRVFVIGRPSAADAPPDVPLLDSGVSRRHAELRARDGQWLLRNLGKAGTMVDQRIVEAEAWVPLAHGSMLSIGPFMMRVDLGNGDLGGHVALATMFDDNGQARPVPVPRSTLERLAELRLSSLISASERIHAAEGEESLARAVAEILMDSRDFDRAAVLEAVQSDGGPQWRAIAEAGATGAPFSRTLLSAACDARAMVQVEDDLRFRAAESMIGTSAALCVPMDAGKGVPRLLVYADCRSGGQPGVAAMRSAMSSAGNTNMPHAAPMQVTINNSVEGASVKTRRGNNGQLEIDFILDVMSDALTRGGNKVDQAMSRAYGARRVGY
jgi:hypothetical protein